MTSPHTSESPATRSPAGRVVELGQPWRGVGPFLFAVHHLDAYPAGNAEMGPATGVDDRQLGSDFGHPSGWNMYHGRTIPGFPAHPHRGFETITVVRQGVVDHADSTGASARYGDGDVQWVTAGKGVSHSEVFPLLNTDRANPFELYQIWLNLPARDKTADPEFTMQWHEDIPVVVRGDAGSRATIRVIAGTFEDSTASAPPRHSWASNPAADVAIWLIDLEPHATIELPAPASAGTRRLLYVHGTGARVEIDGATVDSGLGFEQTRPTELSVVNGDYPSTILVLQGAEIGEPVVQYGPFVMNSAEEIDQAYDDYRRTRFGGWPWASDAPVHQRTEGRFARYPDGRVERPRE